MKDWLESDLARYERDVMLAEERLPHCSICDETIYTDYMYNLDGELYCEECFDEFIREHRVDVESWLEE